MYKNRQRDLPETYVNYGQKEGMMSRPFSMDQPAQGINTSSESLKASIMKKIDGNYYGNHNYSYSTATEELSNTQYNGVQALNTKEKKATALTLMKNRQAVSDNHTGAETRSHFSGFIGHDNDESHLDRAINASSSCGCNKLRRRGVASSNVYRKNKSLSFAITSPGLSEKRMNDQ